MSAVSLDDAASPGLELSGGRPIVLFSADDTADLVDLVIAAEHADARSVAFVIRHTSGFLCAAMSDNRARRLGLPPMRAGWIVDPRGIPLGVSVDAREGITTGISAADRARTLRVIADGAAAPDALSRPGHVVPIIVRADDLRPEARRARAALQLVRAAGAGEVAGLAALVSPSDPVEMATRSDAFEFAARHGLVAMSRESVR